MFRLWRWRNGWRWQELWLLLLEWCLWVKLVHSWYWSIVCCPEQHIRGTWFWKPLLWAASTTGASYCFSSISISISIPNPHLAMFHDTEGELHHIAITIWKPESSIIRSFTSLSRPCRQPHAQTWWWYSNNHYCSTWPHTSSNNMILPIQELMRPLHISNTRFSNSSKTTKTWKKWKPTMKCWGMKPLLCIPKVQEIWLFTNSFSLQTICHHYNMINIWSYRLCHHLWSLSELYMIYNGDSQLLACRSSKAWAWSWAAWWISCRE